MNECPIIEHFSYAELAQRRDEAAKRQIANMLRALVGLDLLPELSDRPLSKMELPF